MVYPTLLPDLHRVKINAQAHYSPKKIFIKGHVGNEM